MTENIDKDKKHAHDANAERKEPGSVNEENSKGETEVKNAHASGDGSFGRNDSSVPEEGDEPKKGTTPY